MFSEWRTEGARVVLVYRPRVAFERTVFAGTTEANEYQRAQTRVYTHEGTSPPSNGTHYLVETRTGKHSGTKILK